MRLKKNICRLPHPPSKSTLSTPLYCAAQALAAGQVIAHPTETIFGLAADPFNPVAMERLLSVKGRSASKGFIVLIPNQRWLARLTRDGVVVTRRMGMGRMGTDKTEEPSLPLAQKLMAHFWPGPLTLVLPACPGLPAVVTGSRDLVALRHSSSPLVMALLDSWQKPIVSTSANATGQTTARCAEEVRQQWGAAVSVVLEGETATHARPSTILRVEGRYGHLLRAGAISATQLRATFPEMELREAATAPCSLSVALGREMRQNSLSPRNRGNPPKACFATRRGK